MKKLWLAVIALAMCAAAARLPAAYDETYYWTWSKTLSWSYFDHPPGIAGVIAASQSVADGLLGLRLATLSACAAMVYLHVMTTRRMLPDHPEATYLAVSACLASIMFTVGFLPATPDPFQALALAACAYAVVRAHEENASGWWTAVLVFGAIGTLFKTSSVLVVVAAVVFGQRRSWRGLLVGAGLSAALLTPWILADIESAGSLAFQGHRIFGDTWVRPWAAPFLSLGALLLIVGPTTGLAMLAAFRLDPIDSAGSANAAKPLAAGALAIVLAGALAAARGSGEVNWVMPAFAFAGPAATVFLVQHQSLFKWHRRLLTLGQLLCLVAFAHIVYPFIPMAPKRDRTLRSAGHQQVAKRTLHVAQQFKTDLLIARRYQTASQLRFHLRDRLRVHELGTARASQYDRWPRPSLCVGQRAVLLSRSRTLPPELHAKPLGPTIIAPRERAGRKLTPYFITPLVMTSSRACESAP